MEYIFYNFYCKNASIGYYFFIILLIFAWLIFPNKEIKLENFETPIQKKVLFVLSLIMLIVYLIFLEIKASSFNITYYFYFLFYFL